MLTINVAPDGSGQFTTISEAVLAVPYDCPAVIRIAPGIYREKLVCEKKDINHPLFRPPANTGEKKSAYTLKKNEIASCTLEFSEKIVVDEFDRHRTLGELILIDRVTNMTSASFRRSLRIWQSAKSLPTCSSPSTKIWKQPEIQIAAEHILRTKKKLNEILAANTGKPLEVIQQDTERDNFMSAEEAKEYGLIDEVIVNH